MEKKQGEIELLEVKTGVSATGNAYRRGVFTINKLKYSTFDQKIIDGFKPGDVVEMEGEQQGPYWNMKTMIKIDDDVLMTEIIRTEGGIVADLKPIPVKNGKEFHLTPEAVKLGALNAAIKELEIVANNSDSMAEMPQDDLLKIADKFVEWVYN